MLSNNYINLRFFISFLFILEFICLFSYSSSIFFFFIFFFIFLTLFSNISNLNIYNDLINSYLYNLNQLNTILILIRYKKKCLLHSQFFYVLLKVYLSSYKLILNNQFYKIFSYIKFDFFLKFNLIL